MSPTASLPNIRALIRDGSAVPIEEGQLGPLDEVDLDAWYHTDRPTPPGRPWVIIGMIASIDGATTMDGLSGGLGNPTDRRVLVAVRTAGQVVIVGASTARDEMYRPANFTGQRVGVVTRGGELDYDSELFTSGVGFVMTTADAAVPAGVDVVRAGRESVDFSVAFQQLGAVVGPVSTVVVEGGPTLNGAVVEAGIVDELCLTTSAMVVSGNSHRLAFGSQPVEQHFELAHLLLDSDHFLFARWVRRHRR